KRFCSKNASEREQILVARVSSLLVLALGSLVALAFTNAAQMFDVLLMVGAGTGLVYLLRWLWWRVNAWSEISASLTAIVSSYLFTSRSTLPFADPFGWAVAMGPWNYVGPVVLTTFVWLVVTFLTKPENSETLTGFVNQTSPPGSGWDRFRTKELNPNEPSMGSDLLKVFFGSGGIIATLIGTGLTIYGEYLPGLPLLFAGICVLVPLFRSPVNSD
ncbi:MAG: Na+:solute symporter, partial [Akkermansiaceae bacterium]